ncbi:hypothetical protein LCGC14_0199080 [marine sediment metagenome]|uniref:acid phosphatase n=1 Tax=marine sediment metagenome TaxID=412755 RepID=A0A0F9XMD3_9ZZZZ|nr:tartrate-resistant acid phosphatase type 5 family protein [Maribacter sp.]HDZ03918.1 acid phosphatase [Maribacter sp.]
MMRNKIKKKFAVALIVIFAINVSCSSSKEAPVNTSKINKKVYVVSDSLIVWDDALHFLVFGDWGRKGDYHQQDVADRMEEAAKLIDAEFVIALGDNFYPNGVASVHDPNWMFSYENIYKGYHLEIPWYVVLGNHDYRGNPQAQVDYTKISQRWNMPSRYYDIEFEDEDTGLNVNFMFLDTSPFEKKYYSEKNYFNVKTQDSTQQIKWIDSTMRVKSKADWTIFSGHHPLYSGGKRLEATEDIRNALSPILKRHSADVYFAGHEHDMQYIKPDGKTHHFISGAGSEVRTTGMIPNISKFAASVQGFMAISITKEKMLVQVINYKGNVIYSTEIDKE